MTANLSLNQNIHFTKKTGIIIMKGLLILEGA